MVVGSKVEGFIQKLDVLKYFTMIMYSQMQIEALDTIPLDNRAIICKLIYNFKSKYNLI